MVSRVDRDAPPETLYVVPLRSTNAKIVVSPDEADFSGTLSRVNAQTPAFTKRLFGRWPS
jgi:hypothetical protein